MLLGLDFDNTIAGYDKLFRNAAAQSGLLSDAFSGGKTEIRDAVRALDDGDRKWMRLQAEVYGPRMSEAALLPGIERFLARCRENAATVFIVSHKSEFAHFDIGRSCNLRDAAWQWLATHGFFDVGGFGLNERNVYFESTREEKINRIKACRCTHFVDDLVEVFEEPSFPTDVRQFLLASDATPAAAGKWTYCRSWNDVSHAIFGND